MLLKSFRIFVKAWDQSDMPVLRVFTDFAFDLGISWLWKNLARQTN